MTCRRNLGQHYHWRTTIDAVLLRPSGWLISIPCSACSTNVFDLDIVLGFHRLKVDKGNENNHKVALVDQRKATFLMAGMHNWTSQLWTQNKIKKNEVINYGRCICKRPFSSTITYKFIEDQVKESSATLIIFSQNVKTSEKTLHVRLLHSRLLNRRVTRAVGATNSAI